MNRDEHGKMVLQNEILNAKVGRVMSLLKEVNSLMEELTSKSLAVELINRII